MRSVVGTDVASSLIDSTMLGPILVSLDHAEMPPLSTFLLVKRLAPDTAVIA